MRTLGPDALDLAVDPRATRLRIGLLVLQTDHTTELDFRRLITDPTIGCYVNRVPFRNPLDADNLRAMQPHLRDAAAGILPGEPLDAIAFSCTSGSAMIGDDTIRSVVREGKGDVPIVTPTSGAAAAFEALGSRRVALLAPYTHAVSERLASYFGEALGVSIGTLQYLDYGDDTEIARIAPDSLVHAGTRLLAEDADADALFVSCTAARAAGQVERLEALTGKAVVTSNTAMLWRTLRAAGEIGPISGIGRLGRL